MIAGVSLLALGVAAVLPTVANDRMRTNELAMDTNVTVDPIVTGTTDRVAADAPTQTQIPDMPTDLPTDMPADMATQDAPRQILSRAPEAVLMDGVSGVQTEPAGHLGQDSILQSDADAEVSPTMTADLAAADPAMSEPRLTMATTTSVAGDASDPGGIILALDHARVMRVVGDVATIIIGNPFIADASMPDPSTMVLTGKSYGETNMVMLDSSGAIVAEQTLRVTVRGQSLVSVYRGVQRTTLSCSPTCEIRPTPGDAPEAVSAGINAFQARNQAALGASTQ
jgi:hypothetical protein